MFCGNIGIVCGGNNVVFDDIDGVEVEDFDLFCCVIVLLEIDFLFLVYVV